MRIKTAKEVVDLDEQQDFVAAGGQATIYRPKRCNLAYKIYHDPKKMNPKKISSLQVLNGDKRVKCPIELLYRQTTAIGYTLDFVEGYVPWAVLFTHEAWKDNNITLTDIDACVLELVEIMGYIHSNGFIHGDPNPLNFLVKAAAPRVVAIDIDGIGKSATDIEAVSPIIQDYGNRSHFSQLSDWYGIAIIVFWLYTEIHPYRPRHPVSSLITNEGIIDRMKKNLSAYHQGAKLPPDCKGLDGIPVALSSYFEDTFRYGKRLKFPDGISYQKPTPAAVKSKITLTMSSKITLEKVCQETSEILDVLFEDNKAYCRTAAESALFVIINGLKVYVDPYIKDMGIVYNRAFVRDNRVYLVSSSESKLMRLSHITFGANLVFAVDGQVDINNAIITNNSVFAMFFNSLIVVDISSDRTKLYSILGIKSRFLNGLVANKLAIVITELNNIFTKSTIDLESETILETKVVTSTNINAVVLANGIIVELSDGNLILAHKKSIAKKRVESLTMRARLISDGKSVYIYQDNYLYKVKLS